MPAVNKPASLTTDDNKWPDGALRAWVRGQPMIYDVIYAESDIGNTGTKPGAAAHKAAQNKMDKYMPSWQAFISSILSLLL